MDEDFCAQLLGNCELDQLLEEPASNRHAMGVKPDVGSEADPQRVEAMHPDRKHLFLRHDVRPVVLEGAEQREVNPVDDDPVLDPRRARFQTSAEQRTAVSIEPIAGRDEGDRCGHVRCLGWEGGSVDSQFSLPWPNHWAPSLSARAE